MEKQHVYINKSKPLIFVVLVFALSIPFWILGYFVSDSTKEIPIKLPIAALMFVCPFIAAMILVYKEDKANGVKELLKKVFDFKKIRHKSWYFPIIFLMPLTALLSYWYLKFCGMLKPLPTISISTIFIFFVVYLIGALGEEVGWSGYIIDPMQNKFGALKAAVIIGIIWAVWHIIPYYQAHQNTQWIFWQCIGTVCLRVIMVWIYNNAGKSVFAIVCFHIMINISPYLIPHYGANYNPFICCLLLMVMVVLIVWLWDAKTLTSYRFSEKVMNKS